jgi:phospholipid transport system substrate-binding protein
MKLLVTLAIISALVAQTSPALAEGPGDQLKNATVRVVEVLQDRQLREAERLDARRNQIRTIVNEIFDWQEAGRQVLSRHWEPLAPQEREEFVALFGDIIQRSYIGMMDTSRGEEIAMVLIDEALDGERATVRTNLVSKSNILPMTYRLIKHESSWKVYDVAIDGISFLSNSRSQIGRLIQHVGYGGLMKMLKMKQTQLASEETERGTKIIRVDANP